MFSPSQFAHRPAVAQVESELRGWLRRAPIEDRVAFLETLWGLNPYFAFSLAHTSQLPKESAIRLLAQWVQGHGQHAKALIEVFVPLLGERKFWQVVSQVPVPGPMARLLAYERHGASHEETPGRPEFPQPPRGAGRAEPGPGGTLKKRHSRG